MTVSPPHVHYVNWPNAKDGPWLIGIHLASVGGRLECVGVEILSYERDPHLRRPFLPQWDAPGEMERADPIRATTLRDVPLGKIVRGILDREIAFGPQLIEAARKAGLSGTHQEKALEAAKASRSGRGGRKGHSAEHYAEVARVYAEAWAKGDNPTQAVAAHWTVAKSTAAKWVSRARNELGFLGPTTQGRPGVVRELSGSIRGTSNLSGDLTVTKGDEEE